VRESEQRRILDRLLEEGRFPKEKRVILRECYLQKNRMESAAEKLRLSPREAELWYTAFSLGLVFASLRCGVLTKKNG
jgi:hypothetical protein